MADIRLTAGDDAYQQPIADKDAWNNVFGEAGNDTIRLYNGIGIGGPGNDRIERVEVPGEPWRSPQAAFWSAGAGLRVDLAAGWAEDGEGGRDTLVGIDSVHGSGADGWVQGNDRANFYWPNGGNDVFLGGGGDDGISLNSYFEPAPGQPWRSPLLGDLRIEVSVDGRHAVVTPAVGRGFRIEVTDVEYFEVDADPARTDEPWVRHRFADFITHQAMAEQAIVAGPALRWNAAQPTGSAVTVSFSFVEQAPPDGVGAAGFRAFSPAERALVRDLLADTAAFTGLTFVEVVEGAGEVGSLRFGVSRQADTRGVSWQPNQPGAGDRAGDVWMDVDSMASLVPGSEGLAALLHEIGHALGLRHPRAEAGESHAVELREGDDRTALSVMSQSASADGLHRADWGPLDVLALRHLYGARDSGAGDDVYRLGGLASSAQTTLIDDGGIDTIDASALAAGVSFDLAAGSLSSVGVSAAGFAGVENLALAATTVIEHAIGSSWDDVLFGNALDNRLTGGPGNDWIDGRGGSDTAVFAGRRADYDVSTGFGKVYVAGRDGEAGFDTLVDVERLEFDDQVIALAPVALAADADYTTDEDSALQGRLPDPGDGARGDVSYRLVGAPAHGDATVSADGTLRYTPRTDFWGDDWFTWEIATAAGANRYLAVVEVLPVNDGGPVAAPLRLPAAAGAVVRGTLPRASDPDGDPVAYGLGASPRFGLASVDPDGGFVYQSTSPNRTGTDSFDFLVSDGLGGNATYTVTLDLRVVGAIVAGSEGADTLAPGPQGDGYAGYGGDDRITGGAGDDLIDGGDGIDTAVYASRRQNFTLTREDASWHVVERNGGAGHDRLVAVERLAFADRSLALDLDGHAGTVAGVLRALLGPAALQVPLYAGYGLQALDGGMSEPDLVALAISATPLATASNADFVRGVYRNVFGSEVDAGSLALFTGLLDSGAFTKTSLGLLAARYEGNAQSAEIVGLATTGLEYVDPPG